MTSFKEKKKKKNIESEHNKYTHRPLAIAPSE